MKVGYCVPITPHMASFRLRVAIPSSFMSDFEIGCPGDVSFFYKHGDACDMDLALSSKPFVYDVVNDHFASKVLGAHYRLMCGTAAQVTCSSAHMAEIVEMHTSRRAVVINDPYENLEQPPRCLGQDVLWFGHSANISSLWPVVEQIQDLPVVLTILTNYKHPGCLEWSRDAERRSLERAAVVLLTGNSPGASSNRVVKALRAGRFVVTPGGIPAWDEFSEFIWIGDPQEGIKWALANRGAVCEKIRMGQEYTRGAFAPRTIAARWTDLFDSISPRVTSGNLAGSPSTWRTDIPRS